MTSRQWANCDLSDETVRSMVCCFCHNFAFNQQLQKRFGFSVDPQVEDFNLQCFLESYMNRVIHLRQKWNPDLGFFLKLAPPCMQCPGSADEVPVERGENEFHALKYFKKIAEDDDCVPVAVFYDKPMRILCTQELTGFWPLCEEILTQSPTNLSGAAAFGATLAAIHSATHISVVGREGHQDILSQIPTLEPMISMIRSFHYERPYDPNDLGHRCDPEVDPVLRELCDDLAVMAVVEKTKHSFVHGKECLIHGDLHINSVIIKNGEFKMVDLEFARVGPCAYDMGHFLATSLLLYYHQRCVKCPQSPQNCCTHVGNSLTPAAALGAASENTDGGSVQSRLEGRTERESNGPLEDTSFGCLGKKEKEDQESGNASCILTMCQEMLTEYFNQLKKTPLFDKSFRKKLLQEIAAFTACEVLSSIVGPAHFDFMDDSSQAQVDGVESALRLLRRLDNISTVEDFIHMVSL